MQLNYVLRDRRHYVLTHPRLRPENLRPVSTLLTFDWSKFSYEDESFLGYNTVQYHWSRSTFHRCVLPPSSGWWRTSPSVRTVTAVSSLKFHDLDRSALTRTNFRHDSDVSLELNFNFKCSWMQLGLPTWEERNSGRRVGFTPSFPPKTKAPSRAWESSGTYNEQKMFNTSKKNSWNILLHFCRT
jgi:hypothetical protein